MLILLHPGKSRVLTFSSTMRKPFDRLDFSSRRSLIHFSSGVMVPPIESLTEDGYDLQFGCNVLGKNISSSASPPPLIQVASLSGPFYFTQLLLPLLIQTAKSNASDKGISGRVITTSSIGRLLSRTKILRSTTFAGHQIAPAKIDYRFTMDVPERLKQPINTLYATSKLVEHFQSSILCVAD